MLTENFITRQRPITRSCSFGDALSSSSTSHALTHSTHQHQEEEGSPRQRRITIREPGVTLWTNKIVLIIANNDFTTDFF